MRVLLLTLLAAAGAHAQGAGTLAGVVRDAETGEPLIGANVYVEGTALGAATDVDGAFVVRGVPAGACLVVVSYVGFVRGLYPVEVVPGANRLDPRLAVDPRAEHICLSCGAAPVVDRTPYPSRVVPRADLLRLPVGR